MTNADLPVSLRALMEGAAPPDAFVSNGCSCCPDEYGGVDLRPACHWHDYAYSVGGDEPARKRADQAFYRNLRRCDLGRLMAGIYYRRVRLFGMQHWPYPAVIDPGH